MALLLETRLPNLFRRGKVRDTYDLGDKLLMVATDRISAFDVVLPTGIPEKGAVLTQLSAFWFDRLGHLAPNHFDTLITSVDQLEPYRDILGADNDLEDLVGRSMLVRRAEPILVECVVRGYISGSGWAEYKNRGTLAEVELARRHAGERRVGRTPLYTATKADSGHDENISIGEMANMLGSDLTETLRRYSVSLYEHARSMPAARASSLQTPSSSLASRTIKSYSLTKC